MSYVISHLGTFFGALMVYPIPNATDVALIQWYIYLRYQWLTGQYTGPLPARSTL